MLREYGRETYGTQVHQGVPGIRSTFGTGTELLNSLAAFDPPKAMLDALAKVAYEGPHQYAVTFGAQNFREALARKQGKAIGREINPNTEIVVTCGGTEAMMTICNPGDKVMVFSPFYENYGADAILSGAGSIYIPLVPLTYEFDIRLVEEGFKAGAKAIIVCNPSNPCGKVFTREELMAIGELALKYDGFVVTDEVYEHMVYAPNRHVCMASLPGMYDHTITCNSLSKTYSITGWRNVFLYSLSGCDSEAGKAGDSCKSIGYQRCAESSTPRCYQNRKRDGDKRIFAENCFSR